MAGQISHHQDHLRKRLTEDPEQSDIPLSEDDMDIAIGASGTTTTTTVTPLPESAMTRRYPSRVRKTPERY